MQATRVEVITVGTTASIFIDYVSAPALAKTKCTFNEKFSSLRQSGGTANMLSGFQLAYDVCLGKYSGQKRNDFAIKTVVFVLTNGKWNALYNPIPIAQRLRSGNVEIFAIGVGNVNIANLQALVEEPSRKAFYLREFNQFSELATYIRGDPYEHTWQTQAVELSKCNHNCDRLALCACGLVYGDYKCACPAGYHGSGIVGQCNECPSSTYKNFIGYAINCNSCPANSGHPKTGSRSIMDCKCLVGYSGNPHNGEDCKIRKCALLSNVLNGFIKGGKCCNKYLSKCSFECLQGYELRGSATRQCRVNGANLMVWSGTPVTCEKITCPVPKVTYANPASGHCFNPDESPAQDLVYGTKCTFSCMNGYELIGNQRITCQLDKSWSPSPPTCKEVRCPPLPKVSIGTYIPSECDGGPVRFNAICTLRCPHGYHISHGPTSMVSDSRICNVNGEWDHRAVTPTCKDFSPPTLNCPGPTITAINDKGKNVATVNWGFSFNDNSLNQPGTTKDSFTIVLTINGKDVDRNLPKLVGIGVNTVKYTVTDAAKNSASCFFSVEVRDTEPPTCSFCPADIHLNNATGVTVRVHWKNPICSDNSGNIPSIVSSRASGDSFIVPGSYEILYTVSDGRNVNKNCSFRITLKKKQCPIYAPPKNGALVCMQIGSEPTCQVQCKQGYDFVFKPPLVYFCSGGQWNFFSSVFGHKHQLPWPDCKVANSPQKIMILPYFYFTTYSGDYCHDSNVQASVKGNFMNLMMGPYVPPFFCQFRRAECRVDAVKTYCKGQRKRKRSAVKLLIPQDFPRRGVKGRA